jgi:hypothetical protein
MVMNGEGLLEKNTLDFFLKGNYAFRFVFKAMKQRETRIEEDCVVRSFF